MKRYTLILGTAVAASLLSTPLLALDRANTSERGSLLVFPKVDVSENHNTLIRLENDYFEPVNLKCYWKNGTKFLTDFQLELKENQPIWISAKDGKGTYAVPPFPQSSNWDYVSTVDDDEDHGESYFSSPVQLPDDAAQKGELQCWAVNGAGDSEIRWNHLAGSATVMDTADNTAFEYNAWNFRCLVGNTGDECVIADIGKLDLDGAEYEACPKKLVGHFSPKETDLVKSELGADTLGDLQVTQNELTIASCNQDLTQDQQFHFTKLKFNVWNEQETKYTGAYQCMDSWHSVLLDGGIQNNGDHFTANSLRTDVARFKVKGMKSSVCERPSIQPSGYFPFSAEAIVTEETGLLGVLATNYDIVAVDDAEAEPPTTKTAKGATGSPLHMLGKMSGFITYDPAEPIEERPAR
ncbi:hypothetical protein [Nitrosococcus watsonii]|uniref:Ig-like domain-containing protein n=1 Tax=Nitrosococcus watsoni (strain C-113) TaxID=105559 RepID=D8KAV1_NITWC|nr:hypothetical protein [Nitrosococcus watsonii]ADJ29528.1 conserved hypothetical protein [Nitrosococcus watsonii C-113]